MSFVMALLRGPSGETRDGPRDVEERTVPEDPFLFGNMQKRWGKERAEEAVGCV